MAAKISKEDLAIILKNIAGKKDYDSMLEAVEAHAEEYGIDLTERDEDDDDDSKVVIEEIDDDFFRDPNGDDDDDY